MAVPGLRAGQDRKQKPEDDFKGDKSEAAFSVFSAFRFPDEVDDFFGGFSFHDGGITKYRDFSFRIMEIGYFFQFPALITIEIEPFQAPLAQRHQYLSSGKQLKTLFLASAVIPMRAQRPCRRLF